MGRAVPNRCPKSAGVCREAPNVALDLTSPVDTLRSAISSGVRRAARDLHGRGPSRARTYLCGDLAFCVLDGALAPFERTLCASGRHALVRRERAALAGVTARKAAAGIEDAAGVAITAHAGEVVLDSERAIEVVLLSGVAAPCPDTGPVHAEIANAVAREVHEAWGRGPTRTRAFMEDEFVFCILEEPLTEAERALRDVGDLELVRELRRELCAVVRDRLGEPVARVTGRRVVAAATLIVGEPELCCLVLVLGGQV